MNKLFACVLVILFCASLGNAQTITVYPTYQRYLSGDGVVYEELLDVKDNGASIKVKNEKEKLELKGAGIWGLLYKEELFRTEPNEHTLMMLVNKGKICYYENGESNLWLLKNDDGKVRMSSGWEVCFSLGLEDPLVVVPTPGPSVPKKPWLEFKKANESLEPLFDCIKDKNSLDKIRDCVQRFEDGKLK
jgi:hypothetical protein